MYISLWENYRGIPIFLFCFMQFSTKIDLRSPPIHSSFLELILADHLMYNTMGTQIHVFTHLSSVMTMPLSLRLYLCWYFRWHASSYIYEQLLAAFSLDADDLMHQHMILILTVSTLPFTVILRLRGDVLTSFTGAIGGFVYSSRAPFRILMMIYGNTYLILCYKVDMGGHGWPKICE